MMIQPVQILFLQLLFLACFNTKADGFHVQDPIRAISPDSLEIQMELFLGAEGYQVQDDAAISDSLLSGLKQREQSVFRADAEISPLGKTVLILEAMDGNAGRVRYLVTFGRVKVEAPPAADPVTVSFVQADRFNLGGAIHSELVRIYGEENVAPPDEFDAGPHVSWRLVTRPLMGLTADVIGAARRVIPDEEAAMIDCLGTACTVTELLIDKIADWNETDENIPDFDPTFDRHRDGVLTPAMAVELLMVLAGAANIRANRYYWRGFDDVSLIKKYEWLADASGFSPFSKVMIETGLGQDAATDAAVAVLTRSGKCSAEDWNRLIDFSFARILLKGSTQ